MNCLSWNCRRLGRSRTVQDLVRLVRTHSPKLVFLSETRRSEDQVKNLRCRLGLRHCLTIKGEGKGGGLALFWDESLIVDLQSISERHIDILINEVGQSFRWRGTFVYGKPKVQDRYRMWNLLRQLNTSLNFPWMMVGDFANTRLTSTLVCLFCDE